MSGATIMSHLATMSFMLVVIPHGLLPFPFPLARAASFAPANNDARAQESQRVNPPSVEEQRKVLAVIKETYKKEYQLKEPAQRIAFAQDLLKEALAVKEDTTTRYAMLLEARNLAAMAGNIEMAFQVVNEIANEFSINSLTLKTEALETMSRSVRLPNNSRNTADQYIRLAEEGVAADKFDDASALLKKALALASDPSSVPPLTQAIQEKQKDIANRKREYEDFIKAEQTLLASPGDPEACLKVGRYLCFAKDDWQKGIPLLQKCTDQKLKNLADQEFLNPKAPEAVSFR